MEAASAVTRRKPAKPRPEVLLTPREREVVELYVAGETAGDIAAQLGINLSTVRELIDRARRRYREHGVAVSTKIALGKAFRELTPGA